ncbi:MAG: NAD-glutamate dehydrogenase, partial [Nocardioides sp.]|nr:NAD-glutamate dehydrogenase [Nocardioides sp.]
YLVHQQLTASVLETTDEGVDADERVGAWERSHEPVVTRAAATLEDICRDDAADLARLSVGLRVVRALLVGAEAR